MTERRTPSAPPQARRDEPTPQAPWPSQVDTGVGHEGDGATEAPDSGLDGYGKAISAPVLDTAAEEERERVEEKLRRDRSDG